MPNLPNALYRSAQVRELDRVAIEERGIPGLTLMERAGKVAWDELQSNWTDAKNITVLCGGGNNAGDGYVLARLAIENNYSVRVLYINDPATLKGDAKAAADKLLATSTTCDKFSPEKISDADIIVEALLGTGIDREVCGEFQQAIEAINGSAKAVLSIDIPSGLNADTGRPMGAVVKADVTITFIGLKQGLFTGQGPEYCGRLVCSDLDVAEAIYNATTPSAERIDLENLVVLLPKRTRTAHKGNYGHVLIIGGDYGHGSATDLLENLNANWHRQG